MEKTSGIYKITSPSGRIYIGQSINIESRFNRYFKNYKSNFSQIRLYRSFLKHGIDNHIFEIIEECEVKQLNKKERYWQDFYDSTNKNGLNCTLTTTNSQSGKQSLETILKRSGKNHFLYGKNHSEETKQKISLAHKDKKVSLETRSKLSKSQSGENNSFFGKKHKESSRQKMREAKLGKTLSQKTKDKLRDLHLGEKKTSEHRENISKAKLGEKNPMFGRLGKDHPNSKCIVQIDLTGNFIKVWFSLSDIEREFNLKKGRMYSVLKSNKKIIKEYPDFIWNYKTTKNSLTNEDTNV